MDKLTKAVKAFYEAYPYPTGLSEIGAENDPGLLLSKVRSPERQNDPLQVLEAGCGCGLGLLAAARRNLHINFMGIDINQVGITSAQEQAEAQGLNNICFQQVDLMTLEKLEAPEAGYDLIYSLGVLHHLSHPATGLKNLGKLLTAKGVISCMLYGRYGREPLQRLVDAIGLVSDPVAPLEERLQPARLLATVADNTLFRNTPWKSTAEVDDIEFVDRCLHVHEQSYDIESLWLLLQQAGMRFIRWLKPREWSPEKLIQDDAAVQLLRELHEKDQYKVIERLFFRPRFELLITHASDQQSRAP